MIARLDPVARDVIGRFFFKICLSAALALFGKSGFLPTLAGLLALYATITAVTAAMQGQRFSLRSFNQWDEVIWLSLAAIACSWFPQAMP